MQGILAQYKIGDSIDGEITGIANFGAFIKFGNPPLEGLIHISEIDWNHLEKVEDVLKVGQEISVKLIDIDKKTGKMKLSRKVLLPRPTKKEETN